MGLCCRNCFADAVLKQRIGQEVIRENCDYCNTRDTFCVDASELQSEFAKFCDIYLESRQGRHFPEGECILDHGRYLHELIQEDWHVFSEELDALGQCAKLTKDIFLGYCYEPDRELDVGTGFFSKYDEAMDQYTMPEFWFDFCESIKHKNRFFNDSFLDREEAEEILSKSARTINKHDYKSLFRARIGGKKLKFGKIKPYPISQMGAPSSIQAGNGRANPKGIAYLYLATDVDTVISEMRPVKNAQLSVSKVSLLEDISVVDFSGQISIPSPFGMNALRQEADRMHLLQQIGEYFSMPIDPASTDIDYVPTQFISEYIKSLGYDGFVFQSSLGSGLNFVIFDPQKAKIRKAQLYNVTDIQYKFELTAGKGK